MYQSDANKCVPSAKITYLKKEDKKKCWSWHFACGLAENVLANYGQILLYHSDLIILMVDDG